MQRTANWMCVAAAWAAVFLGTGVVQAEEIRTTQFEVGYIDSAPKKGTAETVLFGQGSSSVAKILLNADGSECRVLMGMPEVLRELDANTVTGLVATFEAQIGGYSGEGIRMYAIDGGTKLGRRPWEDYSDAGSAPPTLANGPSWRWADGPADTNDAAYVRTDWSRPNVLCTNGVSTGPWYDGAFATAIVDVESGTVTFDMTELWRDPVARGYLLSNGAMCVMDPACWPAVRTSGSMPRVNLYRPDPDVEDSGHTSFMTIWTGEAPAPVVRPAFVAISVDGTAGMVSFEAAGLDAQKAYGLFGAASLDAEAVWTRLATMPADGTCTLELPEGAVRFFQLQEESAP